MGPPLLQGGTLQSAWYMQALSGHQAEQPLSPVCLRRGPGMIGRARTEPQVCRLLLQLPFLHVLNPPVKEHPLCVLPETKL